MAAKVFFNGAATTSSAAINATQTSITGQSTATWPPGGDYVVRIDGFAPGTTQAVFEDVLVTANVQGTGVVTVTRGVDSTSPQAFAPNATLTPVWTAKMVNDAFARIDSGGIALPISIGGSLPVTGYGTIPVKIDDILVGTDSRYLSATGAVTFLNTSLSGTNPLPVGFRHLLIEWYARSDANAVNAAIVVRFNNIATASYDWNSGGYSSAALAVVESIGTTFIQIGDIPAANATANYFGTGEAKIKHYNGTVGEKVCFSQSWDPRSDATGQQILEILGGKWRTTGTPITRVDVIASSSNFVPGSLFTLYGIP